MRIHFILRLLKIHSEQGDVHIGRTSLKKKKKKIKLPSSFLYIIGTQMK